MKIGQYTVFETVSFILPKADKATFVVGPKKPFTSSFTTIVTWTDQDPEGDTKKTEASVKWQMETKEGKTVINLSFTNLKLPFGGAFGQFAKIGNIGNKPFGFMTNCQTYGDSASFTIQFMMEVGDE